MASAAMLKVLALLYFIEVSVAVKDWNDLRVRFSPLKSNGFYKIPLNTTSEEFGEYVKVEKEAQFDLDIYCFPNDPRGCIIVDKEGNVIGFQVSFLKEDYANVKPEDYDISKVTNFIQTNHFNISAHSFRIYFANPEKLKEKGRQNKTKGDEGIWVYMNGELKELPRYQPSTTEYEGFYQQGCVRGMGLHYFHDINKNVTDCSGIFPLFLLYDDKDLIGVGLATAGKGSSGPQRDWYERPPSFAIGRMVPNAPPCLTELASNYGVTSMHVYFVNKPWMIACKYIDTFINKATDWMPFRRSLDSS